MRTTQDILRLLAADPAVRSLCDALSAGRRVVATGSSGSSTALLAGAVAMATKRPLVLVVAHLDEADDSTDEINAFAATGMAMRFPALEVLPGESRASLELFAERAAAQRAIQDGALSGARVLVCPIQALMQATPAPERLDALTLRLKRGQAIAPETITRWLDQAGYARVDAVDEPGQFAVRGGIIDLFPAGAASADEKGADASLPVRLDFFGDELETISHFDPDTMGSGAKLTNLELVGANLDAIVSDAQSQSLLDLVPAECSVLLHETLEVSEQARGYFERVSDARGLFGPPAVLKKLQERFAGFAEINQFSAGSASADLRLELPVRALPGFSQNASEAAAELGAMSADHEALSFSQNEGEHQRLGELIEEFAPAASGKVERLVAFLHRGFVWEREGAKALAFVPTHELLHRFHTRRRLRRLKAGKAADVFLDLQPGDYVVHADHGVAKFVGLRTIKPAKLKAEELQKQADRPAEEYLVLEFAGRAKLNVPATQIELVQKYIGGFKGAPPLSTLGGKKWQAQKERTSEAVKDLAAELLRVQAARAALPGVRYPADTAWQKEFEAEFPYQETDDQLAALAEIKKDMQSPRPMDRLLCGDVGYGKTELAIRAAFKAVEYGKQVAILVPTTVLAEQHERTFRARFAAYPFRIESVSRFKTAREQNQILAAVRKGQVDVVIGTHRLLSKDVRFKDLGLVIVDEEQRFGVEHKNALLALRMTVDVLTLSATPIPRTLHMAMLGLRDISSLATPPLDRRAVVTEVFPSNQKRIGAAIARELNREGQVFYVHNRVHNIKSVADDVQKLAPGAKIVIGHGQMNPHELEEVMLTFIRRQADILVSTTIIESGIDIPTANTMIINDADRFGLADLHQLRGRVGRHKHRAYCYLLLPLDRPVTETAQRRLRAIEEFSMLGAGFKIAMRDLEIRGAGNILGPEQSGHIAAVGYDMYCRLLDRAVHELKNEKVADPTQTTVEIGLAGVLPKTWIPSDQRRMDAYRRIARAGSQTELAAVVHDLTDAYGAPPKQAQRMLDLAEIRIAAHELGVRSMAVHEKDVVFRCESPEALETALTRTNAPGTVRTIRAVEKDALHEVFFRPPENFLADPETLAAVLRRRLVGTPEASAV